MPLPGENPTEQTPLLIEQASSQTESTNGHDDIRKGPSSTSLGAPSHAPAPLSRTNVAWICVITTIQVFTLISGQLKVIPLYQVLEDIICRDVAQGRPVDDCGNDKDVQAGMAFIMGWLLTLAMIPGILTAVPYGYFADKYGRKLGMMLAVVGMALQDMMEMSVYWFPDVIPVRAIWLSSLPLFIGGGPYVLNGINLSLLSRLATERYRSSVFFYFGAISLAAVIISLPVTAILMQKDLWLPVYIGMGLSVPATVTPALLPKSLFEDEKTAAVDAVIDEEHLSGVEHTSVVVTRQSLGESNEARSGSSSHSISLRQVVIDAVENLRRSVQFFIHTNKAATLLLATLLTTSMGKHSQDILLQYVRSRYGWSWAQTGYLSSFQNLVTMVLLLVLLPGVNYAFRRLSPGFPTRLRDLLLARASLCFHIAGSLAIAIAPSSIAFIGAVFVYSLGSGYNLLVKSLLATVVAPAHHGLLFSTTSMLESMDALLAGPLVAAAFREGLALGGVWRGLPYLLAAVLISVALVVTGCVKLPPASEEENDA